MPKGRNNKTRKEDLLSRKGTGVRHMTDAMDFGELQYDSDLGVEEGGPKHLRRAFADAAPMFEEQHKRNACARRLKAKAEARKAEAEREQAPPPTQ